MKGLAEGYNSCAVTREQYAEGLQRIYPRLQQDAAGLEEIRKLLLEGRGVDEKRLRALLDSYFTNVRRFAEISGSKIVEQITAVVERETGKVLEGQDKILEEIAELKRRLEQVPKPAEVRS